MLATSKRLRSSSPPSSPLDQVTKRRRQTSFHQGPPSVADDDDGSGQQPQWAMAGPSGWRGDVPPAAAAAYHRPPLSPWEHASAAALQQQHHRSPTARSTTAPHPSSYFQQQQQQPVPSPLSAVHSPPSYFPLFPPASASSLQHATQGPSMHTPRATVGAQHDSHAHHRNAPLFHPAFVEQHPPWSSSSSAASRSAVGGGGAHGRPPDGMGLPGEYGLLPPQGAVTPLMGPPTLPVPRDDRANMRRASFGRVAEAEDDGDGGGGGGAMQEDDDANESDTWDDVAGTVHDNLQSLADSPYAGMNQLLHSLHRPRQPRPDVASSPYPHFAHGPTQHRPLHTTPETPHDHGPGVPGVKIDLHESSATRRRYGDVNRQLGELVLNRRVGRNENGEGG